MAFKITDECISCGSCEAECPNHAIFEPGAGDNPLSDDHYYIDPTKCTECKGFFDEQQCASVCPMGACVKAE